MNFEHEPDVARVISECQRLINQFQSMALPPGVLLEIDTKISGRYSYLMEKKAEYQARQNTAYWIRKVSHSREAIEARNSEGITAESWANHFANMKIGAQQAEDVISIVEQESYSVWRYEHIKGFCHGIDKVLNAIAHRLRDFDTERRKSNQGVA